MARLRSIIFAQGDSLRSIAARELRDETRWAEIARINDLRLPFTIESYRAADRLPGTLIWGDTVLVPTQGNAPVSPTRDNTWGADLALPRGQLTVSGGDLATLSGEDNIVQALSHRIKTLFGELAYHPRYGSHVRLALGLKAGPLAGIMASVWVQEALQRDPRVQAIQSAVGTVAGDVIRVEAKVLLVGGNSAVDLNLVLNP